MIKKELYNTRADGVKLYRSYSDSAVKIQKVGTNEVYDEAVDIEGADYIYTETDIPIEGGEELPTRSELINALDELGVQIE